MEEGVERCDITSDVQEICLHYPAMDPNQVYAMLEDRQQDPDRRAAVMTHLSRVFCLQDDSSDISDIVSAGYSERPVSLYSNSDSLVDDAETVSQVLPFVDKEEIYLYLDLYHDAPDRVRIVTDELLAKESNEGARTMNNQVNGLQTHFDDQQDMAVLIELFPDCDPEYINQILDKHRDDRDRLKVITTQMLEKKDYPKMKEKIEQSRREKYKDRIIGMNYTVDEFLTMFPNPQDTFGDKDKQVSSNYRRHSCIQLQNQFLNMNTSYIQTAMQKYNSHYMLTKNHLENEMNRPKKGFRLFPFRKLQKTKFTTEPRTADVMPDDPDEWFYRELYFVNNEKQILDHIAELAAEKKSRIEDARVLNQLLECPCCYDDELLTEDMLPCPDGHLFCRTCLQKSTEELMGQAKYKFPCLDAECEMQLSFSTLQQALSPHVFSALLRKTQEEEIRQADIADLVSCPYCSFATIIPNQDDKVFKCLNADCMKETCRLCKEPNHIPLKCQEVEKEAETHMRTYIENQMTDAMLRTCNQCKKRFYKTEGCNKMTCSCGATMCYVCRKPIQGYSHFTSSGGCPQDSDVLDLHRKEVVKGGQEAKSKYKKDHPEAAKVTMKHDPLQNIG